MKSEIESLLEKEEFFELAPSEKKWWRTMIEGAIKFYDKVSPDKDFLLTDPLSRATRIVKGNLIIFSLLLILIATYGNKPSGTSIFSVGLDTNEKYVFPGVFCLLISYLFVSYCFHYIREVVAHLKQSRGVMHELLYYPFQLILNDIETFRRLYPQKGNQLADTGQNMDAAINNMAENSERYGQFIKKVIKNYSLIKTYTSINYVRFFLETVIWDGVMPICLSLFALISGHQSMLKLLGDIF